MLLILFRIIVNWYYVILLFSGFVGDQREYNDRMNNKTHPPVLKSGPGMIEPVERFRLNNLSFAGPVIMGVGGKKFGTVLLTGSNNQYRIYESRFFMPFKPIIVFLRQNWNTYQSYIHQVFQTLTLYCGTHIGLCVQ